MRLDLGDGHVVPGLVVSADALAEDAQRAVVVLDEEAGVQHHRADGIADVVVLGQRDEALADVLHLADVRRVVDDVVEMAEEYAAEELGGELLVDERPEAVGQFARGALRGVLGPLARGDGHGLRLVCEAVYDDEAEVVHGRRDGLRG